jgi:hypothetical protein
MCGSPLQIVMAVWCLFKILSAHKTAIIVCRRLPHPTQQVQNQKMCPTQPLLSAAQPSEDISRCFFKGRETLGGFNMEFISDEYERVKGRIIVEEHPHMQIDVGIFKKVENQLSL